MAKIRPNKKFRPLSIVIGVSQPPVDANGVEIMPFILDVYKSVPRFRFCIANNELTSWLPHGSMIAADGIDKLIRARILYNGNIISEVWPKFRRVSGDGPLVTGATPTGTNGIIEAQCYSKTTQGGVYGAAGITDRVEFPIQLGEGKFEMQVALDPLNLTGMFADYYTRFSMEGNVIGYNIYHWPGDLIAR